ncbi:PH domain-containing protein [Nocardioides sp. B-3]|uniref:PH domain-containing protein n=1 Tax=Nocardioides sp. B-3 TaxID=2895565 RepID=UPI002152FA01|nr:PH domain-containing protein [Nocardioides sp. B-3]UUZ58075.1 PH domain-containing protein [Nocardioides sp. B-3]
MAYPTKLLNDGEHVVISTRTHPKALIGPAMILIVVVAAVLTLANMTDSTVLGAIAGAVSAGIVVWFVLRPFIDWLTTTYTFTNRRFIKRSGLIAKEGRTIPLNRISGVDFEIGVIDRIFGCGTLIVSDASTNGRVLLDDIPHVEQVQLKVAEELHAPAGGDRSDDGT